MATWAETATRNTAAAKLHRKQLVPHRRQLIDQYLRARGPDAGVNIAKALHLHKPIVYTILQNNSDWFVMMPDGRYDIHRDIIQRPCPESVTHAWGSPWWWTFERVEFVDGEMFCGGVPIDKCVKVGT